MKAEDCRSFPICVYVHAAYTDEQSSERGEKCRAENESFTERLLSVRLAVLQLSNHLLTSKIGIDDRARNYRSSSIDGLARTVPKSIYSDARVL